MQKNNNNKQRNSGGGNVRYRKKKNYNSNKKPYTPKKYTQKPKPKFVEIQYSDKIIFVLGGVTLLSSILMWFMGHREEATYIGIWVPGIFSASSFIRLAFTRAKRK